MLATWPALECFAPAAQGAQGVADAEDIGWSRNRDRKAMMVDGAVRKIESGGCAILSGISKK